MRALLKKFLYDNVQNPSWLLINKIYRPMFTPTEPKLMTTPGRRGAYHFGNERGVKEIKIDVTIMAENDNDMWIKAEWLAGWLDRGVAAPLEFNDEPERYYMATFQHDGEAIDQLAAMGAGTLTFVALDPYKFGGHFNYNVGNAANSFIVTNNGTAPMQPLITAEFTRQANFFGIASPDGFIQFGTPAAPEQPVIPELETVLFDQLNDLAPWTASGINLDYGIASGSMRVDGGHQFKIQDWGDSEATAATWHGPVLKRSLPESIQNFRVDFHADLYSNDAARGRIELWLLNAAGAIVARMIMWDRYNSAYLNTAHITAGPNASATPILESWGPKKYDYNNFHGNLVLRRNGTLWTASVQQTDSKGRYKTETQVYERYVHPGNADPIAQIQIGIRKYGNGNNPTAALRDIRVERINDLTKQPEAIPSIFQPGDRLEIDLQSGNSWKNGEYFNQYLDPGSTFFSIDPGLTELRAMTTDPTAVNLSIDYDERYK